MPFVTSPRDKRTYFALEKSWHSHCSWTLAVEPRDSVICFVESVKVRDLGFGVVGSHALRMMDCLRNLTRREGPRRPRRRRSCRFHAVNRIGVFAQKRPQAVAFLLTGFLAPRNTNWSFPTGARRYEATPAQCVLLQHQPIATLAVFQRDRPWNGLRAMGRGPGSRLDGVETSLGRYRRLLVRCSLDWERVEIEGLDLRTCRVVRSIIFMLCLIYIIIHIYIIYIY